MPEVDIQRRQGNAVPWWVWLLGAIALIALIWWIVAAATPEREAVLEPGERVAGERQIEPGVEPGITEPGITEPGITEPAPVEGAELGIPAILADTEGYFDQNVEGTAVVSEVVGDRGFWVEQEGRRMFVLLNEGVTMPEGITAGERVRLQGTVENPGQLPEMPEAAALGEDVRTTLANEPAFIEATEVSPVTEMAQP